MSKTMTIARDEFDTRIERIQARMADKGIDLLVTHACECESATVRYLTNFWSVFDFVGVLIPIKGKPILLTGGPESYDFAVQFAQIDDVRVHPMYVETCAPEWDKPTNPYNYSRILDELRASFEIKKIGIANVNTIPYVIYDDIAKAAKGAEIVPAEDIILGERVIKSEAELDMLREAYRITEESMKLTAEKIRPGITERELLAFWKARAFEMGAEGFSYPVWVTSGPSTYQSLCKATDRAISNNEMVQFSVGAKFNGYCGNLCRVAVLGKIPERHMDMIKIARECLDETLASIAPGIAFADVYDKFQNRLNKNGFGKLSLYGPAHSTGLQECEAPWVDNRTARVFEPNMAFNIDIWIADDKYGVRLEDGIIVTDKGLEALTTWHRDIIKID